MLIKVNRPFAFSPTVQRAALPIGFDGGTWPASDTTGLITGWGETLDSAARTKLRGVEMKVNALFVDLYCMDGVNYSAYFAIPFPATSLCLLRPSPDVFASACKGDSGGPFVVTIEDKKYLVGVASQAQAPPGSTNLCTGTTPANYVRVTAGLDWIIP